MTRLVDRAIVVVQCIGVAAALALCIASACAHHAPIPTETAPAVQA